MLQRLPPWIATGLPHLAMTAMAQLWENSSELSGLGGLIVVRFGLAEDLVGNQP